MIVLSMEKAGINLSCGPNEICNNDSRPNYGVHLESWKDKHVIEISPDGKLE